MKKLIAVLVTALTMSAGLVGISGAPTQAAPKAARACVEPSCYNTTLTLFLKRPDVARTRLLSLVRVRTEHWITPTGRIRLTVTGVHSGDTWSKVVSYGGGARRINGPHFMTPGLYSVTASFSSLSGRFGDSSVTKVMKVV
jgi:hypothetical protein